MTYDPDKVLCDHYEKIANAKSIEVKRLREEVEQWESLARAYAKILKSTNLLPEMKKMIDTDKYEGHTPAPWKWGDEAWSKNGLINGEESLGVMKPHNPSKADAQLIADAPLLLAFYKRIKEIMDMDEIEEIERVELILQEMIE